MPDALSGAMGNGIFIAVFKKEVVDEFHNWAMKEKYINRRKWAIKM